MYQLNEEVDILVSRTSEPSFDRACEQASRIACNMFGVDDCGHINNVKGAERTTASIEIEFKRYISSGSMCGWSHDYVFVARVVQEDDDEDENNDFEIGPASELGSPVRAR
jgi:hypothetical protein